MPRSTRTRRLLLLVAAVVVVVALVTPIVLTDPGSSSNAHCVATVQYKGDAYDRRSAGVSVTQSIATGVGILSGCGQAPTDVNVRSLIGIQSARAVAIEGDPDIYVRPGVCGSLTGARLGRCLAR